jgi:indole-3-glycerol phosphate synthase
MTGHQAAMPADLLATIVAATRRIVAVRESIEPLGTLARRAEGSAPPRPDAFRLALARSDRVNIVAECKRRSPSRGVLRADYDPVRIARAYEVAGAAAISVLTEPTFFDGSLEHLRAVRAAVALPLLRKDFIVSEYQLFEARSAGANAILLIVGALPPLELRRLSERAGDLGLDVLMEVHTREELEAAVECGARIIGVNNRNLRTLSVDVRGSEELITRIPRGSVAVSESGLQSANEIARLRARGFHAFLIGERFISAPDPGQALSDLLAGATADAASRASEAGSLR